MSRVQAGNGHGPVRYFRKLEVVPLSFGAREHVARLGVKVEASELCFNVGLAAPLTERDDEVLRYLFTETFQPEQCGKKSYLEGQGHVVEVGPRLQFKTPWCSNAVNICAGCGVSIDRIEVTRRYLVSAPDDAALAEFTALTHDRMTEARYANGLQTFATDKSPEPWTHVKIMEEGDGALEKFSSENGLGFDEQDIKYYGWLFREDLKRNPTSVELFDMAQGNSEHSRHWFFGGKFVIDGVEMEDSLFKLVKRPFKELDSSLSTVAFADNSSAQRGQPSECLLPSTGGVGPGSYTAVAKDLDVTFTCETHNFPCGIAPLPGAETGSGGRLRDQAATGCGSLVQAGISGYSVGNLHLPGYEMEWEQDPSLRDYPSNMARPLDILVSASNGASDYGNKFGEPLLAGFARTYGGSTNPEERVEWIKPIMLSGGVGRMDHGHVTKQTPEVGQLIIKLGGPAYRIGVGGGAASSMIAGDNAEELDFNAVQRADAEMLQRVDRVIRACVELGEDNPITTIHDQGAGGPGNVLKEITEPMGSKIDLKNMLVGDPTMSALELWVAEYQENFALLIHPDKLPLFTAIADRETAPFSVVGSVTDDGVVRVTDAEGKMPVELPMDKVLGSMPRKTFDTHTIPVSAGTVDSTSYLTSKAVAGKSAGKLLDDVLRLVSVGCKRYLTSKVDRSVGGLVAQQQCVGPRHLPLADVAVVAETFLDKWGAAVSIGEQPLKGLSGEKADMARMARLTVAEALTNMCGVKIRGRDTIKASGNWMWPAKLPGEGPKMYACCEALSAMLCDVGVVIDGGKDSLSMAARLPAGGGRAKPQTVKCPGTLVLSCYAVVPDVTIKVTPDLKEVGSKLLFVDMGVDRGLLAGTALAQVTGTVLKGCSDVDTAALKAGFDSLQDALGGGDLLAMHDVSDGGAIVALLEMAFTADGVGFDVTLPCVGGATNGDAEAAALKSLFSEAPGIMVEVKASAAEAVLASLRAAVGEDRAHIVGSTTAGDAARVGVEGVSGWVIDGSVGALRLTWEETAYELEKQQCAQPCVESERTVSAGPVRPQYRLTYTPAKHWSGSEEPEEEADEAAGRPKVAVLREEGSNGDREMAACFHAAGFDAWDVSMSDLSSGRAKLSDFRGVAFVGGFSFADTFDSAKGWAAKVQFSDKLRAQFDDFYRRRDTFSLGVCNGCQLMALLGLVARDDTVDERVRFVHNKSGRFESRFSTLVVDETAAKRSLWTQGMGGSVLGVWVAHGEGQAHFANDETRVHAEANGLVPFRYCDDNGQPTEVYPMNPNGSVAGIAGLTSVDGRHMSMMPHPERLGNLWNWPYMPAEWQKGPNALVSSPWLRLFQNARRWCAAYDVEVAALRRNPTLAASAPTGPGRVRLAVLLSGSGTTLQYLLDRSRDGSLAADVVAVVSSRASAGGLARAAKVGVPTVVVPSKTYRSGGKTDWDAMSNEVFAKIQPFNVDAVVLAGYMCMLKMGDEWAGRVINVHPALIPAFCGQGMYGDHVHKAVVESGVKVTGCTVHFVDNEYDHGPIIAQPTCPVSHTDTMETVRARVQAMEKRALVDVLNDMAATVVKVGPSSVVHRDNGPAYRRKLHDYLDYVTDRVVLPELGAPNEGKVRDVYLTEDRVVMATSDRLSAFDYILPNLIPFKGFCINAISKHMMSHTSDIIVNALEPSQPDPLVVVQRRMRNIGIECIMRGYVWGSMAAAYEKGERSICGVPLPDGLLRYQKLDEPLFTPTTKAEQGDHDEPMTHEEVEALIGADMATELKKVCMALFERGSAVMRDRGLLLLDTKYEFGLDADGKLHVIDEVNTPDSSRLCTIAEYESKWPCISEAVKAAGGTVSQVLVCRPDLKISEMSKQFIRDALLDMGFDGTKIMKLPTSTVVECSMRYISLYELITQQPFPWPDVSHDISSRIVANLQAASILSPAGGVVYVVAPSTDASTARHCANIAQECASLGLPVIRRVVSPLRQPGVLADLVKDCNASAQRLVIVAAGAGRGESANLAWALGADSLHPVVACAAPPSSGAKAQLFSSELETERQAVGFVWCDGAASAARSAAGVFASRSSALASLLTEAAAAERQALAEADEAARSGKDPFDEDDKPKHECGVAMVRLLKPLEYYRQKYGSDTVGLDLMYFMLEKQRNRGQDGAGLAGIQLDTEPGAPYLDVMKSAAKDPIKDLFQMISDRREDPGHESAFKSELFLGHVRYGTFGGNSVEYLHPFVRESNWKSRALLLAGNFNLTNVDDLFNHLVDIGMHPRALSDTVTCLERIGHFLDEENMSQSVRLTAAGHKPRRCQQLLEQSIDVARVLARAASDWDGGFAMAGLLGHGDAFVIRDRHGIRPCFYWADDEFCVVASERGCISSVINDAQWSDVKEVKPGHALIIRKSGKIQEERVLPKATVRQCVFERIYFSRPSDPDIYKERKRLGEELVVPVLAELGNDVGKAILTFVPNTAEIAFYGFVEEMRRVLHERGEQMVAVEKLIAKDTKLRTFIQNDASRNLMSRHAYDYTPALVGDERDVIVAMDDSIVRGTTLRESLMKRLDLLGPRKIIFVSSCPPIKFPDVYGIDMSRLDSLIAFNAAIGLVKDRGMDSLLTEVYTMCKQTLADDDGNPENHVMRIYDCFTDDDINDKVSQLVTSPETKAVIKVMYMNIPGLHRAIPGYSGDWVFSGQFPTVGGTRCALRSYVNYFEGSKQRSYGPPKVLSTGRVVLVLGSGGREHAIAWKLAQSDHVRRVLVAPGNAGTSESEDCRVVNVRVTLSPSTGFSEVVDLCHERGVDLVVVGPEQPLVDGIADACLKAGIRIFGPTKAAAELEASKAWSKQFFGRHKVPTSKFEVFTAASSSDEIVSFIDAEWPVVVKASGLCAGKGVLIPTTKEEAVRVTESMRQGNEFGSAGDEVVVEKRLTGREISIFGLSDGTGTVRILPPAQDHKRALDNDQGLNTGGMGAYCPAPADDSVIEFVREHVFAPTAKGMKEEGRPFVGVLYAGLMFEGDSDDASTLNVLEFNCRFGDPETQAVLPVLDTDLYDLLSACADGALAELFPDDDLYQTQKCAATVVIASGGYPLKYAKGKIISGLGSVDVLDDTVVFHAGTKCGDMSPDGRSLISTSGGRVLAVTSTAPTLAKAVQKAYVGVRHIHFDDAHFRRDIAAKAIAAANGSPARPQGDLIAPRAVDRTGTPPTPTRNPFETPANEEAARAKAASALTYLAAGVDIDAGDATVQGIKEYVKATSRPGCEMDGSSMLSFGGFCDLARCNYKDPVLVSGTDGVGTKLKVANVMHKHDTIGIDLVAMCVNDCLVHGAEPLFFLDYFATGKLEVSQAIAVIKGVAEGCKMAGCALIGGETAEMPGMYARGDYDLGGFSVGAVERDDVLPRTDEISAGDVLIGVTSSGIHSNGLSLARKIVASGQNPESKAQWSFFDPAPFNPAMTIGDALLIPTRIYIKSLLPVIKKGDVVALAHITGGGLLENIPRVLPEGLGCQLHAMRWEFPPLFRWLMDCGNVAWSEMARTFNCGIGMVLVVKAQHADRVLRDLEANNETAVAIGTIETMKPGDTERVVIHNAEAAWSTAPQSPSRSPKNIPSRVVPKINAGQRVALVVESTVPFDGVLSALLSHVTEEAGIIHVALVVYIGSSMSSDVAEKCAQARVPTVHMDHHDGSLSSIDDLSTSILTKLREHAVDFLCWKLPSAFSKGHIPGLAEKLISSWKGRMLSSYPGLVLPVSQHARPQFDARDLAPYELTIKMNCRFHGITVHLMVPDVEQSVCPVVWQEIVEVGDHATASELAARVMGETCEGRAYVEALKRLVQGKIGYSPRRGLRTSLVTGESGGSSSGSTPEGTPLQMLQQMRAKEQ